MYEEFGIRPFQDWAHPDNFSQLREELAAYEDYIPLVALFDDLNSSWDASSQEGDRTIQKT